MNRAFAIGLALNAGFVVVEVGFGFSANSLALLADAGHNLGDVAGLLLSWLALWLSRRPPTARRTYGFGRSTILASMANAVILLIAVGAIGLEAIQRLSHPVAVSSRTVMLVASIGILVNGLTALLFSGRARGDLNLRSAYLHMAADAAVSLGVVISAGLLAWTGWSWIDPLVSLAVAALIAFSTLGLLRESMDLAMDAVPPSIDREAVERFLRAEPGVQSVHDLHIWPLSTTSIALTAHLVMPAGPSGDAFLHELCAVLGERFGIDHATVQIERGDGGTSCRLAPAEVV